MNDKNFSEQEAARRRDDNYGVEETARRRDAVIKKMLATPPKPHSEMKIGKSKRTGKSQAKPLKSMTPKGITAQSKKRRKAITRRHVGMEG